MQREQRLIVAACTRTRHVKTRAWRLDFFSREPRPRSWINEARGNFRFREENEPHDKFFDPYSSFLFFLTSSVNKFHQIAFRGSRLLIDREEQKRKNGEETKWNKKYRRKEENLWREDRELWLVVQAATSKKKRKKYREATRLLLSIGNAIARAISHGWNRARCDRAILR